MATKKTDLENRVLQNEVAVFGYSKIIWLIYSEKKELQKCRKQLQQKIQIKVGEN